MIFRHTIESVAGVGVKSKKIIGYTRRVYFDYAMLKRALGGRRFERSLEIGCGFGRVSPFIAEYSEKHYAIDPNREFIWLAKKHFSGIKFELGKAQETRYPDNHFDLVVSMMCLTHFTPAEFRRAAEEIKRVMRDGGLLYLCETTKNSPSAIIPHYAHDYVREFNGLKLVDHFEPDRHRGDWVFRKTDTRAGVVEDE